MLHSCFRCINALAMTSHHSLGRRSAFVLLLLLLSHVSGGFSQASSTTSASGFFSFATSFGQATVDKDVKRAAAVIDDYLQSTPTASTFHIQGWRWHTMSLIREATRLQKLAQDVANKSGQNVELDMLRSAADYVVMFNMKGLHSIERDLFFPWVRTRFDSLENVNVARACRTILQHLEYTRREIESLGEAITEELSSSQDKALLDRRLLAVDSVASNAVALVRLANNMLQLEDSYLVPVLTRLVSESEQKAFNNKVIRKLGILDSRLHLVGMHEAVCNAADTSERLLFEATIPSIPQYMIPRWRRSLYLPRVGEMARF